jgi:hypothetical protein
VWGGGEPDLVGRGSGVSKAYLRSSQIGLALALAESKPLPSRGRGVVVYPARHGVDQTIKLKLFRL